VIKLSALMEKGARKAIRALIKLYRYTLSPIFGGQCRFTPSCSAYALEAVNAHGAIKGTGLAMARICRCHPFGRHGFDPVPPRVK
jgi:putative membrane protein insertion efficiency factor